MSGQDRDLQQNAEFDQICTSLPPIKISISGDGGPPWSAKTLYGDGSSRYEEEEECRTPTAEENKIPVNLTCPPAPKKPVALKREKRKRKSLRNGEEFFEVVNRNVVDGFFRVLEGSELWSSRPVVKKRRRIRAGL